MVEVERIKLEKRKNLQELVMPDIIKYREGDLYLIKGTNLLLKEFPGFSRNKFITLKNLMEFRNELSKVEELVLPEKIAFIEKTYQNESKPFETLAYTMLYIKNGVNIQLILNNKNVCIEAKIKLIKMIGDIIKKTLKLNIPQGFYLGDIHEGNFVYDSESKLIRVLDLDSSTLDGSSPFGSKYLDLNVVIEDKRFSEKYPRSLGNFMYDETFFHNENTEWLCYITIILNTISQGKIYHLKLSDFNDYLTFLKDNGFSYELLDKFSKIYQESENEDPTPYLDLIPKDVSKVSLDNFCKKTRTRSEK